MMLRATVWIYICSISVVSQCPATPSGGCSICGDGLCIDENSSNEIFSFPGQPQVACGLLQAAGYSGAVPLESCPFLPSLIGVCNCGDGGSGSGPISVGVTVAPATFPPVGAPMLLAPADPITPPVSAPIVAPTGGIGLLPVAPVPFTPVATATSVPFSTGPMGFPGVVTMPPASPTVTTAPMTTVPVINAPVSTAPVVVEIESNMPSGSTMPSFTPTAENSVEPPVETSGGSPAKEIGVCTATISFLLAFLM